MNFISSLFAFPIFDNLRSWMFIKTVISRCSCRTLSVHRNGKIFTSVTDFQDIGVVRWGTVSIAFSDAETSVAPRPLSKEFVDHTLHQDYTDTLMNISGRFYFRKMIRENFFSYMWDELKSQSGERSWILINEYLLHELKSLIDWYDFSLAENQKLGKIPNRFQSYEFDRNQNALWP